MELHSINTEDRVYRLQEGDHFTALAFDYAFSIAHQVALWCGCQRPTKELIGTAEGYGEFLAIMFNGKEYAQQNHVRSDITLTPQLIGLEGKRVEVIDKAGSKRRFWVAKSTGWLPYHLEIFRVNAHGGPAAYNTPYQKVTVVRTK